MKRKQIITVIAVSMLIGFTACGSENENAAQDNKEKQTEIYSNKKPDHPDYFQIECYFSNQDRVANSDHRRRIGNEINLAFFVLIRLRYSYLESGID